MDLWVSPRLSEAVTPPTLHHTDKAQAKPAQPQLPAPPPPHTPPIPTSTLLLARPKQSPQVGRVMWKARLGPWIPGLGCGVGNSGRELKHLGTPHSYTGAGLGGGKPTDESIPIIDASGTKFERWH